jgi:hypothetical protein
MQKIKEKRYLKRNSFSFPVLFEWTVQDREPLGLVCCRGIVVNLHSFGFGLVTEQPLNEGDVIKVFLPVEGAQVSLPTFSVVRWSKAIHKKVRVGVQFLN